jgi:hypothetical protein
MGKWLVVALVLVGWGEKAAVRFFAQQFLRGGRLVRAQAGSCKFNTVQMNNRVKQKGQAKSSLSETPARQIVATFRAGAEGSKARDEALAQLTTESKVKSSIANRSEEDKRDERGRRGSGPRSPGGESVAKSLPLTRAMLAKAAAGGNLQAFIALSKLEEL